MNLEQYFRSLTGECAILKDRVRHFVDDAHWPTDGEWKESVLRSMLRRSSAETVTIGRGFVVHQESCSTQIDVLIYDNSMPILYRDGDLVFVTPSACRGIVEVKSSTNRTQFKAAAKKLAENAQFIRSYCENSHMFVGFFSYELGATNARPFLGIIGDAVDGHASRLIDHVALGPDTFIKYWPTDPQNWKATRGYDRWHLYALAGMAPGYFIHNLVVSVSKRLSVQRDATWFPKNSKEARLVDQLSFIRATERNVSSGVFAAAAARRRLTRTPPQR